MVFLVAALLSAGCRRKGSAPAPAERAGIRIGVQNNAVCALIFTARERGFFAAEGLDVALTPYPSGKLALKGMLAGEVDVATVADMPVMRHSFVRDDFAVFAAIADTDSGAWIIARRDRGIRAPEHLRGKTVATQRNSAVHFFLSMFLLRHRIPEDEVDLVFMDAVDLPGALRDGRIDAFSMRNPFIREARQYLGTNAVEMTGTDLYLQTFNIVTWKRTLKERGRDMQRLLRALLTAEGVLIEREEDAIQATVACLGADREQEVRSDWSRYRYAVRLDQSIFLTLEDQARWAIRLDPGLEPKIPNFLRFVDPGPLEAVRPEAVGVVH